MNISTFDSSLNASEPQTSNLMELENFYDFLKKEVEIFLGYPSNSKFDYRSLFRFLEFPINNVGDPYIPSHYRLNSNSYECEVLNYFSNLTQAPKDGSWGYVTNGGTEGNMYGLFLARELYPDAMVYYSQDTHYSVDKIVRCLKLRSTMIKSNPDGTMNLDDLKETMRIHRSIPPIIFANIGTTMKGAVDDLGGIRGIFNELAIKRHYVHADAALSGMILPFIEKAPLWDFSAGIDSISISGHKMIGSPIPCGVVIALKSHVDRISQSVEYIGSLDTTLSGSRSGISPLILWYAIRQKGPHGFKTMIQDCLKVAEYAVSELNKISMNAWRHPYSNTVVFNRPPQEIINKWQIAPFQDIAHIITMPQVTQERIDKLVADIESQKSKDKSQKETLQPQLSLNNLENALLVRRSMTIVAKTSPDSFSKIARIMATHKINIDSFAADSLGDVDVIRMSVSYLQPTPFHEKVDLPMQILKGYTVSDWTKDLSGQEDDPVNSENLDQVVEPVAEDAVIVKIPNLPGALAALTQTLSQTGILTRSLRLSRIGTKGDLAVAIIATDNPDKARKALAQTDLEVCERPAAPKA